MAMPPMFGGGSIRWGWHVKIVLELQRFIDMIIEGQAMHSGITQLKPAQAVKRFILISSELLEPTQ